VFANQMPKRYKYLNAIDIAYYTYYLP